MRVEALPTPSEHIPALMARVKPLYLSRTYGIPLPDPDHPTQEWDPEQFLNLLAKMKGRLLKGGEPDVDGVAKIILTDWVRGRIPFFVSPPERPEELNIAEAKSKAKGKAKAVAEAKEEQEVVSVKQNLNSIIQKNAFLAEDIRPMEGEVGANGEALSDEGSLEDGQASEHTSDADDDPGLSWNDVFEEEGHPNTVIQSSKGRVMRYAIIFGRSHLLVGDMSSDEESPAPLKKEPRMKTSKVLRFLSRVFVTFTSTVEEIGELLYACECEEQKPWQGSITQVIIGWQERRRTEASLRDLACVTLDLALNIRSL